MENKTQSLETLTERKKNANRFFRLTATVLIAAGVLTSGYFIGRRDAGRKDHAEKRLSDELKEREEYLTSKVGFRYTIRQPEGRRDTIKYDFRISWEKDRTIGMVNRAIEMLCIYRYKRNILLTQAVIIKDEDHDGTPDNIFISDNTNKLETRIMYMNGALRYNPPLNEQSARTLFDQFVGKYRDFRRTENIEARIAEHTSTRIELPF